MAEQDKPEVVDVHPDKRQHQDHKNKEDADLRGSKGRLKAIASEYYVDARLQEVEQEDLAHRSATRQRHVMQKQQANLEAIIALTYDQCHSETAQTPDPDWLVRFFDLARNIHGHAMQQLWAKILKQEMLRPGSTSIKALTILETMTQREAQALQRACALSSTFGQDSTKKLVTGFRRRQGLVQLLRPEPPHKLSLGHYQLSYTDLMLLMDLGLILRTELESGVIEMQPAMPFRLQDTQYMLTPLQKGMRLYYYRFSPTGHELAKLVGKRVHPDYHHAICELLAEGFEMHSDVGDTVNTHA
ncbi:TIGR03899 family protein [Salinivibrio kushneri]|uniref:TIGR03899 family protein n=1 Tax=Salinivibrio kushneri TaxID=1908198 RepID=UPI0022B3A503|nr:TIGR03899 family protein [Salinivibrio kushneri]WBA17664.1 TIGR03899 family protein [Salinivibrio kushneri]